MAWPLFPFSQPTDVPEELSVSTLKQGFPLRPLCSVGSPDHLWPSKAQGLTPNFRSGKASPATPEGEWAHNVCFVSDCAQYF